MLLDVVIAACAALGAVGLLFLGFRLARRKPPRWMIPVTAALGVLGVTLGLRYQWAARTVELLPSEMVVVERLTWSSALEPWSLVWPVVHRLVVADRGSLRRHPDHAGLVMIDVVLLRRDADTLVARHLVDCGARRDAVVASDAAFGPDGLPEGLAWSSDAPPALYDAACTGEESK